MCSSKFARSWKDHFTCDCPRKVLVCQNLHQVPLYIQKNFLVQSFIHLLHKWTAGIVYTRLQQIRRGSWSVGASPQFAQTHPKLGGTITFWLKLHLEFLLQSLFATFAEWKEWRSVEQWPPTTHTRPSNSEGWAETPIVTSEIWLDPFCVFEFLFIIGTLKPSNQLPCHILIYPFKTCKSYLLCLHRSGFHKLGTCDNFGWYCVEVSNLLWCCEFTECFKWHESPTASHFTQVQVHPPRNVMCSSVMALLFWGQSLHNFTVSNIPSYLQALLVLGIFSIMTASSRHQCGGYCLSKGMKVAPPQKHHRKNSTQKHHHKNTTTKTPPQKHHHTTTKTPLQYYSSNSLYYTVLLQYYSVLRRTTPVLLCTTKYHSSTALYYKVLLCITKYYSSTTLYYKVLLQYYPVLQVLLQCYSVLQSTTPVLQSATPVLLQYYFVLQNTTKGCSATWKVCILPLIERPTRTKWREGCQGQPKILHFTAVLSLHCFA